MKFDDFIITILLTIQAFEEKHQGQEISERRQVILTGLKKAINDPDIMHAYRLVYEKHMIIREVSAQMLKLTTQLMKIYNL